ARARLRRAQVLALAQEPGHRATASTRSPQTAGRRSRRWWETTEETVMSRSSSRTTTLAGTCATSPWANPPCAGSGMAERRANASRRSAPRTIQVAWALERSSASPWGSSDARRCASSARADRAPSRSNSVGATRSGTSAPSASASSAEGRAKQPTAPPGKSSSSGTKSLALGIVERVFHHASLDALALQVVRERPVNPLDPAERDAAFEGGRPGRRRQLAHQAPAGAQRSALGRRSRGERHGDELALRLMRGRALEAALADEPGLFLPHGPAHVELRRRGVEVGVLADDDVALLKPPQTQLAHPVRADVQIAARLQQRVPELGAAVAGVVQLVRELAHEPQPDRAARNARDSQLAPAQVRERLVGERVRAASLH